MVFAWLGSRAPASACSCGEPMFGGGRFYLGESGALPVNATGVPWAGPGTIVDDDPRVDFSVDGRPTPFRAREVEGITLLIPDGGLHPGMTLDLVIREPEWEKAAKIRRKVAAEGLDLPPPTTTARIRVTHEPLRLDAASIRVESPRTESVQSSISHTGGCSDIFDARVLLFSVALPPHLQPFADHLLYRTLVDDGLWRPSLDVCSPLEPGRSWHAKPGADMHFAECGLLRHGGLATGVHTIVMEVLTPDGQQSVRTPSFQVEVTCDGADPLGEIRVLETGRDGADKTPEFPSARPEASTNTEPTSQAAPPALDATSTRGCAVSSTYSATPLILLLIWVRRSRLR